VRGRADDMLVIRGVNVFPSAVEEIVRRQPGVGGEYRIVVDHGATAATARHATGLRLQVEARSDAPEDLEQRLAGALHAELKVSSTVEVLAPGALPRGDQKASRVTHA
jgi:phenylacetate-CoA ligase